MNRSLRSLAALLIVPSLMLLAPVPRTALAQTPALTQVLQWHDATVTERSVCGTIIEAPSANQTAQINGVACKRIGGTWFSAGNCGDSWYFVEGGTSILVGTVVSVGNGGHAWVWTPTPVDSIAENARITYFQSPAGLNNVHQAARLTLDCANWTTACQSCTRGWEPKVRISYGGSDKPCVYMVGENYGPDFPPGTTWCAIWDEWLEYQSLLKTCPVGDFIGWHGGYNERRYLVVLEHSDDWRSGTLISGFPQWEPAFLMADFNRDRVVGVQDIFDFLGAWCAGGARADCDHSGAVDSGDLLMFLSAWFDSR